MLRALDVPYLALNPGASFRGLHDSLVNYLGNERPQMLLCLHEESAVAIAHGYARASGRMMGVVLHSNVGLMHGTMAIFNAWCDRVPMLILGATGPGMAKRRPDDWIHTASDQGALVRDYTKWDNQPGSVPAAYEALMRAAQIAQTAPRGPTYVNLDAALQEAKVGPLPTVPDVSRFQVPDPVLPGKESIEKAAKLLSGAKNPAILIGRVSRGEEGWKQRIALAETAGESFHRYQDRAAGFPPTIRCTRRRRPPSRRQLARDCDGASLDWIPPERQRRGAMADRCQSNLRLGRSALAPRLEHGLPGLAAGGRLHALRAGHCRPHAARGSTGTSCGCFFQAGTSREHRSKTLHSCARRRLQRSDERHVDLPHQAAARLERRLPAFPPPARLSRRRWWRRGGRGARLDRRRGAGAEGQSAHGGRHLRRWRLPDGRHRGVDRGALQAAVLVHRRQ
jgi:hypothetical protein